MEWSWVICRLVECYSLVDPSRSIGKEKKHNSRKEGATFFKDSGGGKS